MIDVHESSFALLRERKYLFLALGIGAVLLALEWHHIGALTGARAAPPPAPAAATARFLRAEGKLVAYPGAEVAVGTDIGGTLASVAVSERMNVKKGDLLAEIDASVESAALAEAARRVKEAEIDVRYFERELGRTKDLLAAASISKSSFDKSLHERDAARARRDVALATKGRLSAIVKKSRITAPIDGVVIRRFGEPGETVSPGRELVTLADLTRTRVEAEVDEYDAGRVAVGADVVIRAEGYAHAAWKGRVEEIPDAVTARMLKPTDPARPSDTRVLLVKIALGEAIPVKLGQRVELEIARAGD